MFARVCVFRAALLLTALWPGASHAEAPALTFDGALRAASANTPSVALAEAALQKASAAERTARGAYFPSLSVQGSSGMAYADQPVTPSLRLDSTGVYSAAQVGVEANLLDFGARRSRTRAAEQRKLAARADGASARRSAVRLAASAYLQVLYAQALLDNAALTAERRREQVTTIATLAKAGLRPRIDLQRAEVEAVRAEYGVELFRIALQLARSALAVSIGRAPETSVDVVQLAAGRLGSALTPDQAVERALAQRPETQAAAALWRAAQHDVGNSRAQRYPVLSAQLSGALAHLRVLDGQGLNGSSYNASGFALLRWNGLDATVLRQVRVDEAEVLRNQKQLDVEVLRVRAEAFSAALDVSQRQVAVEQAERVLTATQATRLGQLERYRAGAASLLELLDAEAIEQSARGQLIEAQRAHDIARAELLAAMASLEPSSD